MCGIIFDAAGHPMSPTFAYGRSGRAYAYYVSTPLQQGRALDGADAIRRVPAVAIEELVQACAARAADTAPEMLAPLSAMLARVEVHPTSVQLLFRRKALFPTRGDRRQELVALERRLGVGETVTSEPDEVALLRVTIPVRMKLRGGRTWLTTPDGRRQVDRVQTDPTLAKALRSAHALLGKLAGGTVGDVEFATLSAAPANAYERKLIRLAFLAPQIQRDILDGRHPAGLTLEQLIKGDIHPSWERQSRDLA